MSRRIRGLGLLVEDEARFGKYIVDAYLPEVHIGIEYDGPMHSLRKKQDRDRDQFLLDCFFLPILRLDKLSGLEGSVLGFIETYSDTAEDRRSACMERRFA